MFRKRHSVSRDVRTSVYFPGNQEKVAKKAIQHPSVKKKGRKDTAMILYQVAKSMEARERGKSSGENGETERWLRELIGQAGKTAKPDMADGGQSRA